MAGEAEFAMPFNKKSIAGLVAVTGKTLNIPDVYLINKKEPYKFDSSFDEKTGYRTRSLLAVPINNNKGEAIGVLELLNRIDRRKVSISDLPEKEVVLKPTMPFFEQDVDMTTWAAG